MTDNTDRPGILDEAAFLGLPQTIDYNPQWRSELRAGNSGDFYIGQYNVKRYEVSTILTF
jgi:hypothetical protein